LSYDVETLYDFIIISDFLLSIFYSFIFIFIQNEYKFIYNYLIIMYCLVKYINSRKEQNIKFLGYSENLDSAHAHLLKIMDEYKTKLGYDKIVDCDEYDDFDRYIHISDTQKGKKIKEYICISIEKLPDEAIQGYINNSRKDETVKEFIDELSGDYLRPQYKSIAHELVHQQSVETIRRIVESVAFETNCRCDFGPRIYNISPDIFGIVCVDNI